MRPTSFDCLVSDDFDHMFAFLASIRSALRSATFAPVCLDRNLRCLSVLETIDELVLHEAIYVPGLGFTPLLKLQFPRLRTLRLHRSSNMNCPVTFDSESAQQYPALRVLDVCSPGHFRFSGTWPCLERLERTHHSLGPDAIDVSLCPQLTVIDESRNASVNLHHYGAVFAPPSDDTVVLPPLTRTLYLGRHCTSVRFYTGRHYQHVSTNYGIAAFSERWASADRTWNVVFR